MTDLAAGEPQLATGEMLNRTVELLRANAVRALVAVAVMAGVGVALDLGWLGIGTQLLAAFLNVALVFWLTASLLQKLNLYSASRPRFVAFFLLGMVTGLGFLIGFILLIVPGLLLLARWSIAGPAVIASDAGVFEALDYSWRATAPHAWPIVAATLIIYAPAAGAVMTGYLLEAESVATITVIVMELVVNAAIVAAWHLATAIYVELQRPGLYSEVFA